MNMKLVHCLSSVTLLKYTQVEDYHIITSKFVIPYDWRHVLGEHSTEIREWRTTPVTRISGI